MGPSEVLTRLGTVKCLGTAKCGVKRAGATREHEAASASTPDHISWLQDLTE